jgi:hypothetical protein
MEIRRGTPELRIAPRTYFVNPITFLVVILLKFGKLPFTIVWGKP